MDKKSLKSIFISFYANFWALLKGSGKYSLLQADSCKE